MYNIYFHSKDKETTPQILSYKRSNFTTSLLITLEQLKNKISCKPFFWTENSRFFLFRVGRGSIPRIHHIAKIPNSHTHISETPLCKQRHDFTVSQLISEEMQTKLTQPIQTWFFGLKTLAPLMRDPEASLHSCMTSLIFAILESPVGTQQIRRGK